MISEQAYIDSAKALNCELAVIKAVAKVESNGSGFDDQGRVKILFEPYIFYKALRKAGYNIDRLNLLSVNNPDILQSQWKASMYGKNSEQWDKLKKAAAINEKIAMESCSYGMFQIMGFNYEAAGYVSVYAMHQAYSTGEGEQLTSFVNYIKANHLDDELQHKDFIGFARQYNGPLYLKNKYDTKLQAAYDSFK